jgi:hypothetical protein
MQAAAAARRDGVVAASANDGMVFVVKTAFDWTRKCDLVGMARVIGLLADPAPAEFDDEQAERRFEAMLANLSTTTDWRGEAGAA